MVRPARSQTGGRACLGSEPILSTPSQRAALTVIAVLMGASAASHQLTPFAILAAATALTLLRRSLLGLPIITAVIVGIWISYMTVVLQAGNLLDSRISWRRSERVGASLRQCRTLSRRPVPPGHDLGCGWSPARGSSLASRPSRPGGDHAGGCPVRPHCVAGLWRRDAAARLPVQAAFMAFIAAAAFIPSPSRPLAWRTRALAVAALGLILALMVTRHGNSERMRSRPRRRLRRHTSTRSRPMEPTSEP